MLLLTPHLNINTCITVNLLLQDVIITAIDSAQYNNESIPSDTICFDNCPEFVLPNVFTPNNDGNNDAFQALMPIRYINAIDMHIF